MEKKRRVQESLKEIQKQEEEVKLLHEREQQDKEEEARRRKYEIENQMKGNILNTNRQLSIIYKRNDNNCHILRKNWEKETQEKNEETRDFVQTESE